jgi:hypothetical protein
MAIACDYVPLILLLQLYHSDANAFDMKGIVYATISDEVFPRSILFQSFKSQLPTKSAKYKEIMTEIGKIIPQIY